MTYRELRPPTGLESVVACLWQQDAVEGAGAGVVPDGCVDLLWQGDRLFAAGPDTGPVVWESIPAVSGWLTGAGRRHRSDPAPLVRAAGHKLAVADARVAGVAADLGVSERQLHRRTLAAVGYGPKTLARVIRLRRLVGLPGSLADRACAAGYASQAHMSDEVRRLTGLSPVRYLEDARPTAA